MLAILFTYLLNLYSAFIGQMFVEVNAMLSKLQIRGFVSFKILFPSWNLGCWGTDECLDLFWCCLRSCQ